MQDDDAPTAQEAADAEALARALEGEAGAPDDALGAAALLQHERRLAGFDASAQARVERRIAADVSGPSRKRRRVRVWLAPAGVLVGACAAALLVVSNQRAGAPGPTPAAAAVATSLPAPSKALLDAQARALETASFAPLERPMREHRATMLAAMRARSGGAP